MDEELMERALALAREAQLAGEPPFAAIVVDADGSLVARATDEVRRRHDFTLHAESNAVRRACARVGSDLGGHVLYTTVEPCPMCFTASWLARISRIVFGCTMEAVHAVTGGQQRELRVAAEKMNALSGEPLMLVGGVLASRCLSLFSGEIRDAP
jgi:tRNA(Arg) A34 adenosine deaminase TadA